MTTLAEVRLWGRTIGAVSLEDGAEVTAFQYTPEFAASGIEVSPIVMPLDNTVRSFPALPRNTFHGLPGLLADSLCAAGRRPFGGALQGLQTITGRGQTLIFSGTIPEEPILARFFGLFKRWPPC